MTAPIHDSYLQLVTKLLARIAAEEGDAIMRAGSAVADRVADDRLIYVIGPGGHSQIGAEEVFLRAGGLACVRAFIDQGFFLGNGEDKSMERAFGYSRAVLSRSDMGAGDLLIIVNAYGINAATIDSADYAHEVGAMTVGITSIENQRSLPPDHPSRHPSKRDLCDLVDIVIDTKMPVGDALLKLDGVREKVGPVSTFANGFAINAVMLEAIAELARRGIEPAIWRSANSPGGDEVNLALRERYRDRIRDL